jgi:SH3 domain-containing YSC84-like protein 1
MLDVLTEMLVAGKDKILSVASFDFGRHGMSLVSHFFS